MSMSPKGIILHEGYNDLGSFETDITKVEIQVNRELIPPPNPSNQSTSVLFKLQFGVSGDPVPDSYSAVFTIPGLVTEESTVQTLHTNGEGFIELTTPIFPVVMLSTDGTTLTVIHYDVQGPLDSRAKECYLELPGGTTTPTLYTLIWDLVIYGNQLCIFDGNTNYYPVAGPIGVSTEIVAVHTTTKGEVFGFNITTGNWDNLGTLTFTMIEHPENLTSFSDGFYQTSSSSGTLTTGTLGETGTLFEQFKGIVTNPEPFSVDVHLDLFSPASATIPVYSHDFTNLMQGSINYIPVSISGSPYSPPDISPTLSDIETVSGVTFSTTFSDFLTTKGLTTTQSIRKIGPITYVNDFPGSSIDPAEVSLLQSHVDLRSLNSDINQNQHMIAMGYGDLFSIASVPKDKFLTDVVDSSLPLFAAAQIHEVASQSQRLVGNLLAGTLTDMSLASPATPDISGSNFRSTALAPAVNSCGCNDCQSGITPFAYLMDLLKYGAAHINHTTTPLYTAGGTVAAFTTLITDKFFQPFGTLNVDCDTLHTEFCRVRLVTEVLEKVVDQKISAGLITAARIALLAQERKQYLTLVYRTILTQAGTSFEELRSVVATQPSDKKIAAAQKLADRLGIPLYVPFSSVLTADRMWLTFNNGTNPPQDLTAVSLETIFGFRDTRRNVLTPTPISLVEQWQTIYLRALWKDQDYTFTDYSREDVNPASDPTFKSNWKPIVDPDIMCWSDMTNSPSLISSFAKSLWQNRKADTDLFLKNSLTLSPNVSRTSADFNNRILRVTDRNLVNHVIDLNKIEIEKTPSVWKTFNVINRKLTGTDTDVFLAKSIPNNPPEEAMFQPNGPTPKMRYKRVLNVTSTIPPLATSFTLTWSPDSVFADLLLPISPDGYVKLISSGDATVFQTSDASLTVISNTSTSITLGCAGPSAAFCLGNKQLIFKVEVPLYTTEILDPGNLPSYTSPDSKIVDQLFTVNNYSYTLLVPASPLPIFVNYTIWITPILGWPPSITETLNYLILKQMRQLMAAGIDVDAFTAIINENLRMNVDAFNRMMTLLLACEKYLLSMYTAKRPTTEELYELVSIFRNSAKSRLMDIWVKEEIKHVVNTNPAKLQLSKEYFWKSLTEPSGGTWDPSLQTLSDGIAIIDPELLVRDNMVANLEAKPYRDLYDARKIILDAQYNAYLALLISNDPDGYTKILNHISTNNYATPYNVSPYADLQALMLDLLDPDVFKQKAAADVLMSQFTISREDFISIAKVKDVYELNDPNQMPSDSQIKDSVKLLLTGYKTKQLYTGTSGWVQKEIDGTYTTPVLPVFYYNVIKMNLPVGRSDNGDRIEWQKTLDAWNNLPIINPDIVPPENIVNFVPSNWIYTTWNSRRAALNSAYTIMLNALTPGTYNNANLFTAYKQQINLIFGRIDSFTPIAGFDYVPYFTDIVTMENNSEDFRPFISQFGIKIEEYTYLSRIYTLLENLSISTPLGTPTILNSEKADLADIFIHIRWSNFTFDSVQAEYANDIILYPQYFQIYVKSPNNFPLTDLPAFNQWRSPYDVRKAWADTLQTRIDRLLAIAKKWKDVLQEAEDRNMPLMRDALIRALRNDCEPFRKVALRLSKTFFIETQDNCCFKHTRVSFAIETIQGLFYALQTGIFDDFVQDFTLTAPDFKREWDWLGSYASWRSAMFVFLYPDNLLYPTLKRVQSPAFINLSNKLQNANRFSPEDACAAATEFQNYIDDIQDLEIVCSTSTRTYFKSQNAGQCCDNGVNILKNVTYFFAQSKSGTPYISAKETELWDGQGFWEPLPIETKNVQLLGCSVYGDRWQGWVDMPPKMMLFYSYKTDGKLKISYIQKNLFEPDSSWSGEIETDDLSKLDGTIEPAFITMCQQSEDWDVPCFVFSYNKTITTYKTITIQNPWRFHFFPAPPDWQYSFTITTSDIASQTTKAHIQFTYHPKENKYISNQFTVFNKSDKPAAAVRHLSTVPNWLPCLTLVFQAIPWVEDASVNFGYLGGDTTRAWYPLTDPSVLKNFKQVIGAFEFRAEDNAVVIHYKDTADVYRVLKLKIDNAQLYSNPVTATVTPVNITANIPYDITKIYPFYQERDALRIYSIKNKTGPVNAAKIIDESTTANYCALVPEKINDVAIESADCTKDMNVRKASIETKLKKNTNSPQGNATPGWVKRPMVVKELLYEAYYFAPMLLALDQQKRGQYDAALSWYRSIYDYANSLTANRKIFYGLTLEESITNSFVQAPDWLLDPLNPHLIAQTRANAYTRYTIMNIVQCMYSSADREYTLDTVETIPIATKLYVTAIELLKEKSLGLADNACDTSANDCLEAALENPIDPVWANLYDKMKDGLATYGNATLIGTVGTAVAGFLNAGTPDTMAEQFALSFDAIDTSRPPVPTSQTVTEVVNGYPARVNDAGRYLFALNEPSSFNQIAGDMFAATVGAITGISVDQLNAPESASSLGWMTQPIPVNTVNYTFGFANTSGVQNLPHLPFNPVVGTAVAYGGNLIFNNPMPWMINAGSPPTYAPLIDFKFCTPQNPLFAALDLKGNLELYKIHNCRNIAGIIRELFVYAAPDDSSTGIPVIGASGNLFLPGKTNYTPSQYRFRVLIERAKQLSQQAQQMESLFLAALEKEDAENYAQLRAKQDLETARATVKLQDLRVTQSQDEKVVADIQLSKSFFTQNHYNGLIAAGNSSFEQASLNYLIGAEISQFVSAGLFVADGILAGDKFSFDLAAGGFAQAAGAIAGALSTQSSIMAQLASFQRRKEEWEFQRDLAGFDVSIGNQQVKVADDNIRVVTQERQIAVLNTDHAQDSLEFLKNKFTNAEMYNWMGNVLERSYSYMLGQATAIARAAEGQLYFERQETAGPIILDDYWETPSSGFTSGISGNSVDRRGLTGSARLIVDITKLEQHALDTAKRKLQMSKVISLAQNFPAEFQQFKETGVFTFELTNKLFDYDFPGHYLRLINSVKTSVIGLLPVYDQIKASLTADTISYTVIGDTIFQKIPIRRLQLDSVALTSAINATGVFELQPMQSDFLNPFEGMGVESRWEFKMPQFSNRIDFDNIADVLINVEYTAIDSYQYRFEVLQDLNNSISFNRGFSFKNNFPDQWFELGEAEDGSDEFGVEFELKRENFPVGIENLQLDKSTDIVLYFVREDGFTAEINFSDFNLNTLPLPSALEGTTASGKFSATQLTNNIVGTSPLIKLRLYFKNNFTNRDLFSSGKVKDILMLVCCKAELKTYPL